MDVKVTIKDPRYNDVITSFKGSFTKILDYINGLSVYTFIDVDNSGVLPIRVFNPRVFVFEFKPRTASPVWHKALSYQVTTCDTFYYMQSNFYTAMSHYFMIYSDVLED